MWTVLFPYVVALSPTDAHGPMVEYSEVATEGTCLPFLSWIPALLLSFFRSPSRVASSTYYFFHPEDSEHSVGGSKT